MTLVLQHRSTNIPQI